MNLTFALISQYSRRDKIGVLNDTLELLNYSKIENYFKFHWKNLLIISKLIGNYPQFIRTV